jgi:hypothetical protein
MYVCTKSIVAVPRTNGVFSVKKSWPCSSREAKTTILLNEAFLAKSALLNPRKHHKETYDTAWK